MRFDEYWSKLETEKGVSLLAWRDGEDRLRQKLIDHAWFSGVSLRCYQRDPETYRVLVLVLTGAGLMRTTSGFQIGLLDDPNARETFVSALHESIVGAFNGHLRGHYQFVTGVEDVE